MFFTFYITAKIFGFDLDNLTNNKTINKINKQINRINPKLKHLSNNPPLGDICSFIEPKIKFMIASFGIAYNQRTSEI